MRRVHTVTYIIDSAEVIKIEHPIRGDDTRAWGPPYAKYKPDSGQQGPGESAYFLGVCVDLAPAAIAGLVVD